VSTQSLFLCNECGEEFVVSASTQTERRFTVTCPLCGYKGLTRRVAEPVATEAVGSSA